MTDKIVERRKRADRRSGEDRRKCPRRMGNIFPPPGTDEWKTIVIGKIRDFMKSHMMSLSEFKEIVKEMEEDG